ncbi:MAG TPA: coproporphyrinogen dehydrogenase HemZ [Clostridiales bacterium]|nr:coproporphyrinogen dehydrogenase HemZ [Clostridiales bacterium]
MILNINDHKYHYELENICRLFFPYEPLTVTESNVINTNNNTINVFENDSSLSVSGSLFEHIFSKTRDYEKNIADDELIIESALFLFEIFSNITNIRPHWGILTGVRPSKLMRTLINKNGRKEAQNYFINRLLVTPEKTKLTYDVAQNENKIISLSKPEHYSLYISIPFCPTRCSYCSFVSHSVEQAKTLIPLYIKNLCEEIKYTAQIADKLNLKLSTIYWGGGTPTSLNVEQINMIAKTISENFYVSAALEYTVEAGRPDTITFEKLQTLSENKVNRISINPQTFNDAVLIEIGRKHTAQDTFDAYNLARKFDFNINMDLITGLPTDTVDSFKNSIDTAINLNPDNITIHTLALKRASKLVSQIGIDKATGDTQSMLEYANKNLENNGYIPYYLYRQSRTIGNLENVGWAKVNTECFYNVYMMEEVHSVFGCGGGAVTKLRNPFNNEISRIFNFKYPYEYNIRFNEILERKNNIITYYNSIKMP